MPVAAATPAAHSIVCYLATRQLLITRVLLLLGGGVMMEVKGKEERIDLGDI